MENNPKQAKWRGWSQVAILTVLGAASYSLAAVPEIYLQGENTQMAGLVADGSPVAQGVIVSQDSHIGFRIWSDESELVTLPGRYIMKGKQSDRHSLRVRLDNGDWKAEGDGAKQMTQYTVEPKVTFDLVVDGEQQVIADSYSLLLNTALLQE